MNGIRPLLRTVGSLWFAAVLLVLLMVAMGSATVYERRFGSERALAEFYLAPWFRLLLVLVAVNALAAVLARFPFNRKQIGFLLTHGGILLTLAGALATKYYNVDGRVRIIEGQTVDAIDTRDPVLTIEDVKRKRSATVSLDAAIFNGFRVVDNPATFKLALGGLERLEVVRYLPDAHWRRRVSDDNPEPDPAIEIAWPEAEGGPDHTEWLFAGQRSRVGSHAITFRVFTEGEAHRRWLGAATGSEASGTARSASIEVVAGPEKSLHVRFHRKAGVGVPDETRAIEPGQPIAAPWPEVKFRVARFFTNARVTRFAVPTGRIGSDRLPAVLLRLHAGVESREFWLPWSAPQELDVAGSSYRLRFKSKVLPLGFQVRLNRFRVGYYPGKRTIRGREMGRPRSFESYITITDPATGGSRDRVVSMNNPASHRGFTFYQSSYDVDRGLWTELSVSKNPDQVFVFAGYIITILGMLWVMVTRILEQRRLARLQAGVFGPGATTTSEGG